MPRLLLRQMKGDEIKKHQSGKPFADARLAKFLQRRIFEFRSRKSQVQIATEAGFPRPNVLSMTKAGAIKCPIDRMIGLAQALECDPACLFMLALEQMAGDGTEATIRRIFGTVITENERERIAEIRRLSDRSDPLLTTKKQQACAECSQNERF